MLPIVIIGDNERHFSELESAMPEDFVAPVRHISIQAGDATQLPLPALTCPSIIFLDVDQEMDANLHRYIFKLHTCYPDSALIVLIPFGDSEAEKKSAAAGADEVLMKPLSPARLALSMRNLSDLVRLRASQAGATHNFGRRNHGPLTLNMLNTKGQMKLLHHLEQEAIRTAISYFDGHISNAAKALGIGRSTLYRKVDLNVPTPSRVVSA